MKERAWLPIHIPLTKGNKICISFEVDGHRPPKSTARTQCEQLLTHIHVSYKGRMTAVNQD